MTIQPSAITATDAIITGNTRVTIRAYATGLTHSVVWTCGALNGYLSADGVMGDTQELFTARNLTVRIPEDFYTQLPNTTKGTCVLICNTWSEDRLVGQSRCTFQVRTDKSLCVPAVTGTVEDCNPATLALTGDKYTLVSGRSHARCVANAQARCGASVAITYIGGMPVTGGSCILKDFVGDRVAFLVRDSRGYTAQDAVALPVIPYVALTCNASVRRTDPSNGDAEVTLRGQCYRGSFGTRENSLTITCQVAGQTLTVTPDLAEDHSYAVTVPISGLDNTVTHPLTVTAADLLDTVTKTLTVQRGIPVFDWGKEDFCFHVPVELPGLSLNGSPVDLVMETGTSGGWTYRKWSSGIAECWKTKTGSVTCGKPWGSLYYGQIEADAFPQGLFLTAPTLTTTMENANVFIAKQSATAESTGIAYAISAEEITIATKYSLQYMAKGNWK